MKQVKRYELDGMTLEIPVRFDEPSQMYIEDYRMYIEQTVYTPLGHPVMFAGEDACGYAEEESPGGCPDCGSCRFYERAGEHTWIGICRSDRLRKEETL